MQETSKTKKIWTEFERSCVQGKGIDIGCGDDPLGPSVRRFDVSDGDANHITRYVSETFDFVYSSHCLEHTLDPAQALAEWWKLVRPGGYLILIVPDEDLYEQGVFPSRFNHDHKYTFTIKKSTSWSPVSVNVLDLVQRLDAAKVISITLQDNGYDRSLLVHGRCRLPRLARIGVKLIKRIETAFRVRLPYGQLLRAHLEGFDQTLAEDGALAQIQCILQRSL